MLQIQNSWTPAAVSANGYATAVTGLTWAITTTSSSDSLAHLVTITNNTANSHSTKTAVLVGTDADGNVQTESMSLPGASVATTSTKYYKTLLTVVPSLTIGADTMGIGWSAVSTSATMVVDARMVVPAFGSMVITGTINVSVQETGSSPWTTPGQLGVWAAPTAWASKTASQSVVFDNSVQAMRLLVNSVSAGATVSLAIAQGGSQG